MPYVIGPASTFTPLPTGEYKLTLKSWREVTEEKDSEYSKKGDVKVELTWAVTVPGEEDAIRRVKLAIPAGWNVKSTWVHVAEALRLVDHDTATAEGATVDWDKAVNLSCLGTIVKRLKQGSQTEFTDNITAYQPFASAAAAPAKPAAGNAVQNRYNALKRFAGLPENTDTVAAPGAWAAGMKETGVMPMNDAATMALSGMVDLLSVMGGTDYTAAAKEITTIKDGFLLYGKIEAEVEAMG